ncbi:SusC/RagA family TonB-linked outer membrane protein [Pedobacter sp. Leaf216]|uniref:SusC/RagA family TonB-linked outer membrane protein n=1 Tax=Pedobacter sp. Leaf216 TaxID=1735684 RepID=UPI0006F412DF|nr:TonB-dependent receptor [Pedobacter sp. Leaf216]KQM75265.1 SusC/RagA family TonB-linked outer membrane protein [Pedobacter sp. Leaf216]
MKSRTLLKRATKILATLAVVLSFCLPSNAQTSVIITGKVIDSLTSEPMIGVSVVVAGSSTGTQTDMNGRFSITASKGSILLIRYIGYNDRRITIGEDNNLNIKISPASQGLKEVVVLAYGSQRKADITAAVSQVDLSKSEGVPASNVGRLLQGQAPGVVAKQTSGQPGQELQVEIRGNSSLGATSDPLYVVDGFPLGTGVGNNLNSADIESITILKDAASTSVYGSRGANGVVLITTKSGKREGFKLSLTTNNGIANIPDSRRVKVLNGPEFAQFQKDVFSDKIRYFQNREPLLSEIPADFRNPEQITTSTDWYKEILNQNAAFQDYNLSLTNGSEKSSSYISVGYLDQDGSLVNTGFSRVTARANLDGRPNKFLNFGLHLAGAYSWAKNSDAIAGGFGNNIVVQALAMDPRVPVYNADGSYNNYIGGHDNIFGFPNPVQRLNEEQHRQYKSNVTANAYLEVKPIKNVSFRTNINGVFDNMRNHDFSPSTIAGFNSPPPRQASGGEYFANNLNYGMDNLLTYSPKFKDHNLDITIGHIFQKNTVNTANATGSLYPDNLVEYVSAASQRDGSSGMAAFSIQSILSRLNYSYKGKYLLTAAFNREASSRFGKDNRWGNFPSASVGWRVSQESFFPKMDWLQDLKLRGSYGITGNNNIGNYTSQANINSSNYVLGNTVVPGATVGSFPNANLGWEQSRQLDIGVDISMFKGKLTFMAEYYRKLTTDMLLNVEVPAVAGFGNIITNIGKLQNKGFEFATTYRDKFGDFTLNTGFNISFNRNKVLEIDGDRDALLTGAFYDGYNISKIGQPLGLFYGFQVLGIYQNQAQINSTPHNANHIPGTYQYLDGNGDGVISYDTQDMVVIGNPNPKFTWGWNFNVGYKRFDLSVLTNGSYGGQIYRAVEMNLANIDGVFNVLSDVKDRWRSEGNPGSGKWPGSNTYYFTRESNSKYVYSGNYMWIKNITLGYTIPRIKNTFDAKVFFSVDNAFLITKYPGNNPEVNSARANNGNDVISPGRDGESYPVPRTISIGTRINF